MLLHIPEQNCLVGVFRVMKHFNQVSGQYSAAKSNIVFVGDSPSGSTGGSELRFASSILVYPLLLNPLFNPPLSYKLLHKRVMFFITKESTVQIRLLNTLCELTVPKQQS